MIISLLYIIVPVLLILAVLIFYIHSRTKGMKDEIGAIRTQLEKLGDGSVDSDKETEAKTTLIVPVAEESVPDDMNEKNDADKDSFTEVDASAYNTGKSGKIYTKEELELLIKE